MNDARQNLIRILQNAYSGELAAAYAYRGHWQSLKKSAAERERIRQIEAKNGRIAKKSENGWKFWKRNREK